MTFAADECPFTESLQVMAPRPLTSVDTLGNLAHTSKHLLTAFRHTALA
jgi:hypothetical protein